MNGYGGGCGGGYGSGCGVGYGGGGGYGGKGGKGGKGALALSPAAVSGQNVAGKGRPANLPVKVITREACHPEFA